MEFHEKKERIRRKEKVKGNINMKKHRRWRMEEKGVKKNTS
jgi:hypothetical protein